MKPLEFFAWVVSKSRPRIRYGPDPPAIPGTNIHDEDIERIGSEHVDRKYGEREKVPPSRCLRQLFTPGRDGQLPPSDARRQAAPITPAQGAAVVAAGGPASTKTSAMTIAAPAPKVRRRDLRQRIKQLEGEIAALERGKK